MDCLSFQLHRSSLSAGAFYSGQICGIHDFERDTRRGHLHLIKRGPVSLVGGPEGSLSIDEPTLLFLPRPDVHRLVANDRDGADVVCATVEIGGGRRDPIADSLPSLVRLPLADLPGTRGLAEMARLAGMSRARFAVHFRKVTGETPVDYLASWRITLAQGLLRAGRPLKHVALEVGYGSSSALTRAFVRKIGEPPTHWSRQKSDANSAVDGPTWPMRRLSSTPVAHRPTCDSSCSPSLKRR